MNDYYNTYITRGDELEILHDFSIIQKRLIIMTIIITTIYLHHQNHVSVRGL